MPLQKIGNVIFESDNAKQTEKGLYVTDINTNKAYIVNRNADGSYRFYKPNDKVVLEHLNKTKENAFVLDKSKARMYKIINGKIDSDFEVGIGTDKGDKTSVWFDKEGDIFSTAAGIYSVIQKPPHPKNAQEYQQTYEGRIKRLANEKGEEVQMALHQVPTYAKQRLKYFNNKNIDDNRMSHGCINCTKEDYEKYVSDFNGSIYVLPEESDNYYTVENDKLKFRTLKPKNIQYAYNFSYQLGGLYNYYGYNPYNPIRDLGKEALNLDYSSNNLKGFYNDNKQSLITTGLGLLGTVANQQYYNKQYRDNLRRINQSNQYVPIPYDNNAYNTSLSDFYNKYQSGGEVDNNGEFWDYSQSDFGLGEENLNDFNSLVDEIFNSQNNESLQMINDIDFQDELLYASLNQEDNQDQFNRFHQPNQPLVNLSNNERFSRDYLLSKGIPRNVVAGIMGNLKQESNFNPNAIGDNGASFGIAQWQGNRRKRLESIYGTNPSLSDQLDYLVSEKGESHVLDNMKDMTPSEAAYYFATKYERPNPKYANYEGRMNYANQFN